MYRKFFKGALMALSLSFALFFVNTASAANIILSPPKFEFEANPGDTIKEIIRIRNSGTEDIELTSTAQDFIAGSETGQPEFVSDSSSAFSIASWIEVNGGKKTVIKAGEKVEIFFTITVPTDAEPGGHYGVVFFSPPANTDDAQVATIERIGSLVLVRVSGEIKEEGSLSDFETYSKESDKLVDVENLNKKSFFENLPVDFAVRFHNTGNVHLKPKGKIEIKNFGKPVEDIGVKVELKNGVPVSREIVDYIPVNGSEGNILADSFRRFDTKFQGQAFWYKNEDGSKEVRWKRFSFGHYEATLTLDYGTKKETIVKEIGFWIVPWKEIVLGIIIFIALIFGLIQYNKWNKKRLEKKFRKMFEEEDNKKIDKKQ
ncbi:MAG: DUF916 domain-containing protein [Candidatus Gracilibacteria bacterium]|nr:DUF916 domain-containing protein [Candidatus Gracilibacteria bacterium]